MLTAARVSSLKPEPKPKKHADERGLYLLVRPDGGKWWRVDYRFDGRRKTLSVGVYPDVSLALARERRDEIRRTLAAGLDPSAERQRAKGGPVSRTVAVVADAWRRARRMEWSESTHTKIRWALDNHLVPLLGARPIGRLTVGDVRNALDALADKGLVDTAHEVHQRLSQVLRFAIAKEWAERDVTADLRGYLPAAQPVHHPALTSPREVGRLLLALESIGDLLGVRAAIEFGLLTFTRPGELRYCEHAHIDRAARLWRIPDERMKMADAHLVPLSRQAIRILDAQGAFSHGSRWVFRAVRYIDRPMSKNTVNAVLRRLGYSGNELTGHGFRSTARTLLDERLRFPPDVIEVQLAHVVRGPLGATYNRSQYLEQRAEMMQRWADYLDELREAARDGATAVGA
jgi:integrase